MSTRKDKFKTADLCDEHSDHLQICEPIFRSYGLNNRFYGEITTVKCFEDNSRVRETLSQAGKGRVLVVDAGGSRRCAMLGDILAGMAVENDWSGIVLFGLIRDSADINTMKIGVRALGTHPLRSDKRGEGQLDEPVRFAGVQFSPGNHLYADEDGIVVSETALL